MDTMNQTGFRQRPVGEVVAEDYRRAGAFKRFGIDFCCGGGRTVQEACDRKGVDYQELEEELLASTNARSPAAQPDPAGWGLDFLADYIVNVHHRYVRDQLPVIGQFATKVARVHGHGWPEVVAIAGLVDELTSEMEQHMASEEDLLFPHIKALVTARADGTPRPDGALGEGGGVAVDRLEGFASASLDQSIRLMEDEHDRAGEIMRQIRTLSGDFTPPEGACKTFQATYALLEEFEEDLHRHVHLENNVLFPAAMSLRDEAGGAAG
jgi:regulator of cell morphogenesis and NO signaling